MYFFAFLALLFSAGELPRAEASTSPLETIIQTTVEKGTIREFDRGIELRSLGHVIPNDTRQPRVADYFSTIGVKDIEGNYRPYEISVVSEVWTLSDDQHWVIDQWILGAYKNGELKSIYHFHIKETLNGTIIEHYGKEVPETQSAEAKAIWNGKIDQWLKWSSEINP